MTKWAICYGSVMVPSNFGAVRLRKHCKNVLLASRYCTKKFNLIVHN